MSWQGLVCGDCWGRTWPGLTLQTSPHRQTAEQLDLCSVLGHLSTVILHHYTPPSDQSYLVIQPLPCRSETARRMLSLVCVLMFAGSVLSACTDPKVVASSYTPDDSQVLTASQDGHRLFTRTWPPPHPTHFFLLLSTLVSVRNWAFGPRLTV